MKNAFFVFIIGALFLTGCGQVAIQPTPQPTPQVITPQDIEKIVLVEGDLPPAYARSTASYQVNSDAFDLNDLPSQKIVLWQKILDTSRNYAGEVGVIVLNDTSQAAEVFEVTKNTDSFDGELVQLEVGEESIQSVDRITGLFNVEWYNIMFVRCGTVVLINLPTKDSASYAQRLDFRISELICN